MSLRKNTPCDLDGICPYESGEYCSCEYWCGADEPQDNPEVWEENSSEDDEECDGDCANCELYAWES